MDLAVTKREKFGKHTKALRKEGLIPAELYGHGVANLHLSVPVKEFAKVFKEAGESTVVTLLTEAGKKPALIHEVVRDALTSEVAHVDFYEVRMDEKIKTHVPLVFTGEAPAVKEKAAILNKSMSEIEVEALPNDLPHEFTVNLALLTDIDKSVYVRDLVVPAGVKVLVAENTPIVTATPPALKEEVKVEEPVADVSTVKVESDEKKAERAAEKGEKGDKGDKGDTK